MTKSGSQSEPRNVLVGVVKTKRDLMTTLQDGWYRIPVSSRLPRSEWPPKWVAFYEGVSIRPDYGIYRYAAVTGVNERTREELFPGELAGERAGKRYHVLSLGPIEDRVIRFPRRRRFAFLATSMKRFEVADTVNDLFDESPLEESMWAAFQERSVPAERQWEEVIARRRYVLDFAVFCKEGKIDVEADGDSYHITREQAPRDNDRNNELTTKGWHVLRYGSERIRQHLSECVDDVLMTVERLKGFESSKVVPDRFVRTARGVVPQLSLFDEGAGYDARPLPPGESDAP